MRLTARLPTESASRYLQQLCKHWSHKFSVEFTPDSGRIDMGEGRACALAATPDSLAISITAPDADTGANLAEVVFVHIERFAHREPLTRPEWTSTPAD